MKTAIKLVLIYFVIQLLSSLVVAPFGMLYSYLACGSLDSGVATTSSMLPSMLLSFVGMGWYLCRQGYLKGDSRMWSFLSPSCWVWSCLLGLSAIFLIDFVMSRLAFLPDWLEDTFARLQSSWPGIVAISVFGPVLEEMLFRGAITKRLLQHYSPVSAILLSALVFGVFHINPPQVVGAFLSGILLAWLYYKTGSLIPGIIVHVLNNSLSVFFSLHYPEQTYTSDLLGEPAYTLCLVAALLLLVLSCKMVNRAGLK